MNSLLLFPKIGSVLVLPTLFVQNGESAWTLHCGFEKCGVHTNSPLHRVCLNSLFLFTKCGVQVNSPLGFPKNAEISFNSPLCIYKMQSPLEVPTGQWKKCRVPFNFPLCFYKMCSPLKPPTVFFNNAESAWAPHSVIQKCRAQTNSPLYYKQARPWPLSLM